MRLVPLACVVVLLSALPIASADAALTPCGNEDSFVVAVYVHGGSCHHAFAVISRWNAERCYHHSGSCRVAHDWGAPIHHRVYHCTFSARVDHKERHYYAIACITDDRHGDVRARDYPHGDYKPD